MAKNTITPDERLYYAFNLLPRVTYNGNGALMQQKAKALADDALFLADTLIEAAGFTTEDEQPDTDIAEGL